MAFSLVYHQRTGQIFRVGDVDPTDIATDEAILTLPEWVHFADKAVDPDACALIPAGAENSYCYRPSPQQAWRPIRAERDALLLQTDCMMISDYPLSVEGREVIKEYRQSLRDLTKNFAAASEVIFPVLPAFK